MKLGILKRIEGLKLPDTLDADISENEKEVILTLKFSKDETVVPAPEKTVLRQRKAKGGRKILATFGISTPDGEGPQTLKLEDATVKTDNLREGVLQLLQKKGIQEDMVPTYPDSPGKNLIQQILDGKYNSQKVF